MITKKKEFKLWLITPQDSFPQSGSNLNSETQPYCDALFMPIIVALAEFVENVKTSVVFFTCLIFV